MLVVKLGHQFRRDSKPLKTFSRLTRLPRARVISIAMLCLFAHALFVSVTHHHNPAYDDSAAANACLTSEHHDKSGEAPGASHDSHCLSCRLQRNFTSSIHSATVVVQSFQAGRLRDVQQLEPRLRGSCRILPSRAPPLT